MTSTGLPRSSSSRYPGFGSGVGTAPSSSGWACFRNRRYERDPCCPSLAPGLVSRSATRVGAADWLDTAEVGLEAPPAEPDWRVPEPLARAREDERRTVALDHRHLPGCVGPGSGGRALDRASTPVERRASPLTRDHLVHGAAAGFIGLAAWAAGDLNSAADTFRSVVGHLGGGGQRHRPAGRDRGAGQHGDGPRAAGGGTRPLRACPAGGRAGPGCGGWAIAGDLHVGIAEVLREQGDLDGAHRAPADRQRARRRRARCPRTVSGGMSLGRGFCSRCGDLDGAVEQLDRAEARLPSWLLS